MEIENLWMIEHEYCFEEKVLSAKSFKGEKLQVDRTSRLKDIYNVGF